ncbi:hypothetical protein GCM10023149_25090 [Mucilaginibacter gynuensis]|uniref:DUF3891 family protein n=1 Tax=Mucilaginibacter gynuensis TaxID=1302236 RepID=A0ABP8GH30_9SPHI
MIVNYTEKGWEIVTQRAHGMLAGMLASYWHQSVRSQRWFETILAISAHDDARIEPGEHHLLTEQGGPIDFRMSAYDHEHCIRTMEASPSKSRYIALLSSMHLAFVYGQLAIGVPEGVKFMQEQAALRECWRKELGISQYQAECDYRLLEWCDALSLLICKRECQPEARAIEISKGPNGQRHQLIQSPTGTLHISPWPFCKPAFDLPVESRLLHQLCFRDNKEFSSAFHEAPVILTIWRFSRY